MSMYELMGLLLSPRMKAVEQGCTLPAARDGHDSEQEINLSCNLPRYFCRGRMWAHARQARVPCTDL